MKTLIPALMILLPVYGTAAAMVVAESPWLLPETVVVGTRTLLPLAEQSPAVSLLDPVELLERQASGIGGALGAAPGFHVVGSGQDGALQSLFTRGTNSDHTVILFEGRRLPAGFSGNYGLSALELDPGLGLEVARGPGSFLFGADAVGGAINLSGWRVTPGSDLAGTGLVEAQAGSFGSRGVRGHAAVAEGAWAAEVGGSLRQTDNDEPNSGARRRQGRVSLRVAPAAGWNADLQLLAWSSSIGLPDSRKAEGYPKLTDYQSEQGVLISPGLRWQVGETRIAAHVVHARDRLEARNTFFFGGAAYPAEDLYRTESNSVEVQVDHRVGARLLVSAGALAASTDFDRDDLLAGGVRVVAERDRTTALWGQVQAQLTEGFGVAGGLRVDDYSDFDSPLTGSLSAAWQVAPRQRLFARFGTAYAAPQAFDLYGMFGNPALDAERSRSWELGLRSGWGKGHGEGQVEVTVFHQPIRDLIVFDTATFTTANIGRARTEGVELAFRQSLHKGLTVYGHYTYLTAENLTEGNRLLRRPRQVVFAGLRWRSNGFSVATEARHVVGREDIDAGTYVRVDAADYTVVRILGSWEFHDGWTLFGRIENALDERYDEVDGYAALPRGVHLGLRYHW